MRLLVVFLTLCAIVVPRAVHATPKAQVMVVGVSHLVSKRDRYNSTYQDDPLGPKMQTQIAAIVARFAAFHPTKVMVEAPFDDAKVFRDKYGAYLRGKYTLEANEVYQFGYRLAKLAENADIFPVDSDGPSFIDQSSPEGKRVVAALQHDFPDLDKTDPAFHDLLTKSSDLERRGDLLGLFRYLNSDEAILANAGSYTLVDRIDLRGTRAGVLNAGEWYARNLEIYANIMSYVAPGDRVIVFMGQGHEYQLRELFRLSPDVEYVDALTLLQ
jgi:hypothetical protein